jgi:hypothetical protein
MPSPGPKIVLIAGLAEDYLNTRDILLDETESILELIVGPRVGSRGRRDSVGGLISLFCDA